MLILFLTGNEEIIIIELRPVEIKEEQCKIPQRSCNSVKALYCGPRPEGQDE